MMKIGNKKIGPGNPVFIIAELSANHNQSFNRAKKLIETACKCGVDAIKIQTYTPDTMTIDCSKKWFQIKVNPAWKGRTLYELYKEAYTPWEWQPKLKKIAENYDVPLFSTAYDETSVNFLKKMGVGAYKIASFELTDLELLKKVARTKKPVILSCGMANLKEIAESIKTLRENGATEIAVLHCVSGYPADVEEMNLSTIPDIQKRFGVVTGLSDHTLSIETAIAAVALGASIIEKHFTLSRKDGGPDAAFSIEPEELRELVKKVRNTQSALGKPNYQLEKKEAENFIFRRSLFASEDIIAGEKFTKKNIRCIRPAFGLAPKYLPKVLKRSAAKNIKRGTPLSWKFIEK